MSAITHYPQRGLHIQEVKVSIYGHAMDHNFDLPSQTNVSVNSNWVHPPGNSRGFTQKICPGFDFWKLPGGREFDKGQDFVERISEGY